MNVDDDPCIELSKDEIASRINDPAATHIPLVALEFQHETNLELLDKRGLYLKALKDAFPRECQPEELKYTLTKANEAMVRHIDSSTISLAGLNKSYFGRNFIVPGTIDYFSGRAVEQARVFDSLIGSKLKIRRIGLRCQQLNYIQSKPRFIEYKNNLSSHLTKTSKFPEYFTKNSPATSQKIEEFVFATSIRETYKLESRAVEYEARFVIGITEVGHAMANMSIEELRNAHGDYCIYTDFDLFVVKDSLFTDAIPLIEIFKRRAPELHTRVMELAIHV